MGNAGTELEQFADLTTRGHPAPPSDSDALVARARSDLQLAVGGWMANHAEALDDFKFYASEQWPADIKAQRDADKRPCLTINLLPKFVAQVTGGYRQNKVSVQVRPSDRGAPETAQLVEGIVRGIQYESRADFSYVWALFNAVVGGFGYFRVKTDWADERSFDQVIRIARIANPFSVYVDPKSYENDLSDAQFVFVTEMVPRDEFERRWPGRSFSGVQDGLGDSTRYWYRLNDAGQISGVRIGEYWWRETQDRELWLLSTGEVVEPAKVDRRALSDYLEGSGVTVERKRTSKASQIRMALLSGLDVLEGPFDWPGRFFPIVPVYGEEIIVDGERRLRGMVRTAKDPQRAYNFWKTANAELTALAPRAPFVGPAGFAAGREGKWKTANSASHAYLEFAVNPQLPGGGRPSREQPPTGSPAMVAEAQMAKEDLKETTGVYAENLGASSNATSGIAIRARQIEGSTNTSIYPDNLARSIEHAGRVIVDLIPHVYGNRRSVRTLGEDGTTDFVEINGDAPENAIKSGTFDVVVSTGPTFATRRQEAFESLLEFQKTLPPQLAAQVADLVVKMSDAPGADELAKRLQSLVGSGVTPELLQTIQQVVQQTLQAMLGGEGMPGAGMPPDGPAGGSMDIGGGMPPGMDTGPMGAPGDLQ